MTNQAEGQQQWESWEQTSDGLIQRYKRVSDGARQEMQYFNLDMLNSLTAELEQVKRERDDAKYDLQVQFWRNQNLDRMLNEQSNLHIIREHEVAKIVADLQQRLEAAEGRNKELRTELRFGVYWDKPRGNRQP